MRIFICRQRILCVWFFASMLQYILRAIRSFLSRLCYHTWSRPWINLTNCLYMACIIMPKKAFAKNTAEKNGFVAISKSKFWLSLYKVLKDWLHKPLRGSHFIYFIYTHAISCSHNWLCNILYFVEICSHTNTYHRQKKFEWNKKSTK